jgi:hypothetical protein
VTYKTSSGLDDWIYCTLYTHNSGVQVIQRYRWSTHFTVHLWTRTTVLSLHQPYPGHGLITVSLSLQISHGVFLSQSNSFLAISSQSLSTAISRTRTNSRQQLTLCCWTLPYKHFARTTQKTASILKEACLLISFLAVDVLLLRVGSRENVFT